MSDFKWQAGGDEHECKNENDTPQLRCGVDGDRCGGDLPSRSAHAAEFEYKMGHSSPAGHPFHKRLLEVVGSHRRRKPAGA